MKLIYCMIAIVLTMASIVSPALAQDEVNTSDSTGLPGDHFSLQGALDLFKSSSSLEDFEKKLNTEENAVNNLDLNGDGDIDYVRVIDNRKDSTHAIVLQVPVNETEFQDVAVIEIEKKGKESAILQIVGDENLYGENAIVEPFEEKESVEKDEGKKGPALSSFVSVRVIVNVWYWPCVEYMYAPSYGVWISPWRWHYYPVWWKPWRPYSWRWHYMHCFHYRSYYRVVTVHRVMGAQRFYSPYRRTSPMVKTRYQAARTSSNARKVSSTQQGPASKTSKATGKRIASPKDHKRGQKEMKRGTRQGRKAGRGGKK